MQKLSSYVVVDLEMCNVKGIKREEFRLRQELIEIGAVLLDDSYEIIEEFKTFVSPKFGSIDSYIANLTGITSQNTKNAPNAKEALELFASWLPDDAVLVSWSGNDKLQIKLESERKGIIIEKIDSLMDSWIDCQITFSELMNSNRSYKLSEALNIAGIYWKEGEHDALVDAHNTALLFAKMKREPNMKLNSYYFNEQESESSEFNPFAKLLSGAKFGE